MLVKGIKLIMEMVREFPVRIQTLRRQLLRWYRENARKDLPWRMTRDPYAIWVSEAMLQQTQVDQVIPYYHRFLKKFPTVSALGRAPLEEVFDAWSGLGYYSRARNLHAAAQRVVQEFGGHLPQEVNQLIQLPGIGRYTAGAIASIAYDRRVPILDGNVIRVITRYFGIQENPRQPEVQNRLWELSSQLVPQESPGDFNQALMELGALLCTPRQPRCGDCPVREGCVARKNGWQQKLPFRPPAIQRKKLRYLCGILERNGTVLLARRPFRGLLAGLWEFPGGEKQPGEKDPEGLARCLKERLGMEATPHQMVARLKQTLTHRQLEIRAFRCPWKRQPLRLKGYLETRWVPKVDLGRVPFTAGMRRLATQLSVFSLLTVSIAGCATTTVGPVIQQEELKSAQAYYEAKALRHAYARILKVRTVGERLLHALPEEVRVKDSEPSIGILLDEYTETTARAFGLPEDPDKNGCLIVGVIPESPAEEAGLKEGDLVLKIASHSTPTPQQAARAIDRLQPGEQVFFLLEREGIPFEHELTVGRRAYPVFFLVEESGSINAYATPGEITVTTGLLRFVRSDDELAVVMAHELAHLTQGHIAKGMGPRVVTGTVGAITGLAVDIVLPGVGGAIGSTIQAPFSQDFEREADYLGLYYAYRAGYQVEAGIDFWDRFATEVPDSISQSFFNTHPTSPERLLRLQKTIEELESKGA